MALLWRRRVVGGRRNSFFRMQAAHVGLAHVDECAAFAKGFWPEANAAKRGCGGARAPAAPLRGLSRLPSDDDRHGNTFTVSSAHPPKFVSCAAHRAAPGPKGRDVSARTSAYPYFAC